jgi:hypothetical protein
MFMRSLTVLLVTVVLLLQQGCSWFPKKPVPADNALIEALQASTEATATQAVTEATTYRLYYELKHKPMPHQELAIELEIKPNVDIPHYAFVVKSPEAIRLLDPEQIIHLADLKAGEAYHETLRLEPVDEGLYVVKVFSTANAHADQATVNVLEIPIAVGKFSIER